MSERATIRIMVHEQEEYGSATVGETMPFSGNIATLHAHIERIRASIPAEHLSNLKFEIGSIGGYDDSHEVTFKVWYDRLETDEEYRDRLVREAERQACNRAKAIEDLRRLEKMLGLEPRHDVTFQTHPEPIRCR